jgi:hypothetical protein
MEFLPQTDLKWTERSYLHKRKKQADVAILALAHPDHSYRASAGGLNGGNSEDTPSMTRFRMPAMPANTNDNV